MNTPGTTTTTVSPSSKHYPLSNLAYDLIASIYEKSEGLEALKDYIPDAQSNQQARSLFERIREQNVKDIQDLSKVLEQELRNQRG